MKPSEVANALSFREFSRLCGLVNEKGQATGMAGRLRERSMAGRLRERSFQVIRICRDSQRVRILVYLGEGFGKTHWYELAT